MTQKALARYLESKVPESTIADDYPYFLIGTTGHVIAVLREDQIDLIAEAVVKKLRLLLDAKP